MIKMMAYWASRPKRPGIRWTCRVLWITRWILILEVLVLRQAHSVDPCPEECSCLGAFVDCTDRKLTSVPGNLPVWTEVLHLQTNFITNVAYGSLRNLIHLEELDLGNNLIANMSDLLLELPLSISKLKLNNNRILEAAVMRELPKLAQLNLKSNNIYQLRSLQAAINLDVLDLSDNQIKNFHSATDNSTLWPASLTKLKLGQNRIASVPKDGFKGLPAMQSLDLSGNKITDIEGLAFNGLGGLSSLDLEGNALKLLNDGIFWGLSSLKNLNLQANEILAVRKGWLYGLDTLQVLNLTKNKIERIEDGAWEFSRDVVQLDLSVNALSVITKMTFTHAGNLIYLNLSGNALIHMADDSFKQLRRLLTLDLSGNQIGHVLESPSSIFGWLKSLQILRLKNTGAVLLSAQAFRGMKQLQELDLSRNELSSAEPDAFRGVVSLQRLLLNTSSFVCDCDVSGFLHLVQTKFFPDAHFSCGFPPELRGKELKSLTPSQLRCYDKPRPKIESDPDNMIVVVGSNITLQCTASFPFDSPAAIRWKKDDSPVVTGIVTLTARANGTSTFYVSQLTMAGIERTNSGNYQCVASNNFGSVLSSKAKVAVHVFPVFVKYPQNLTVRAGSSASLECSATGTPRPQVRWKKDGGTDFPAAKQRRLRYETGSDVMHIVNVSREDVGVYSCIAGNAAGSAVANASLTVSEATLSTHSDPFLQVLAAGKTAFLECHSVKGEKRIQWLKNGALLFPTNRHFVLQDGQLLVISEIAESDAGIYQCETDGANGYDMGSAYTLRVTRKPAAGWWDLDDKTTWIIIVVIVVIACVLITSLVWLIIIYHTRRKQRAAASSTGTEETILADECNPINGLHPSDGSLDSPMTDYTEYITAESVDEEFPSDRGRSRSYSHHHDRIHHDSSSLESPSFKTYATLKPARMSKAYTASPQRSCNTIPRLATYR